jgi:hypothetical protein
MSAGHLLQIAGFEFQFAARAPMRVPGYLRSARRGGFGRALRRRDDANRHRRRRGSGPDAGRSSHAREAPRRALSDRFCASASTAERGLTQTVRRRTYCVSVEEWVWRAFAERRLRAEHFSREKGGECLLGKAGRQTFCDGFEPTAAALRRLLDRLPDEPLWVEIYGRWVPGRRAARDRRDGAPAWPAVRRSATATCRRIFTSFSPGPPVRRAALLSRRTRLGA